jgi:hypothetical protein
MASDFDKRYRITTRWGQLKNERSSWWTHWQDITRYLLPRNGRYFVQDRDKGNRRNKDIYDNTPTRALKTLAAGLMSGATSPARPWFRLGTGDSEMNAVPAVKVWLDTVTQQIFRIFAGSNAYISLQQMYEEIGAFGTAACIILPDFQSVVHFYPLTIGEYCIATDAQGDVTTLYREFQMTVSQMVKEFGYDNCSPTVQSLYDQGKGLESWITILHAIEPRYDRDPRKLDAKNMAWSSIYFEWEGNKLLRESGFKQFPAVCPRWAVAGGDIYGNSPGMEALGDIKQLQHEQLRKANAIDYQTNPPLQIPSAMKNSEVNRLPGGVTYVDNGPNGATIKTAFEVNLNLQALLEDIQDCRDRIQKSFFADVFLMLDNMMNSTPGRDMTATEVQVRQEEKMLMMGPILERLTSELLTPMVEITFTHMQEVGLIPPAPPEMQGQSLSPEFISVLAQAQRAIATNSIDRFIQGALVLAQSKPEVLDNIDSDQWAQIYSDDLGTPPQILVPPDQVQAIRQARAKAQAAQAQTAMLEQQSKAAKNMAQAPTSGPPNALQDVMSNFSGYTQ